MAEELVDNGQEGDDERRPTMMAVAEGMARLAEEQVVPKGNDSPGAGFDPEDVNFDDPGSWIPAIKEIEGWLNLLIDDSSPAAAVTSLIAALHGDQATVLQGELTLSTSVLQSLEARVQTAEYLRDHFLDHYDEGENTLSAATREWMDAWEESESYGQSEGSIAATTRMWAIRDFPDQIEEGTFDLSPSFQRSDVWPTKDAQSLIESVLRGIPLPSIIVLELEGGESVQVVDGKQRITALLRFTGQHPKARALVHEKAEQFPDADLVNLFDTDYPRFRRAWKRCGGDTSARFDLENFFPFKLPRGDNSPLTGDLSVMQGKYFTQILEETVRIGGKTRTVNNVFRRPSSEYQIPVITFTEATRRQIHDVFGLYNRQGKKLNAEEIRNAVYHHLDLARAVLVVAGDNTNVDRVAPVLSQDWATFEDVGQTLADYDFGTVRYKRSKVLAWVLAHLTLDPGTKLSTAKLIDKMFDRVADNYSHPLNSPRGIRDVMTIIARSMELHSEHVEAWDPDFVNSNGTRWQELQLVASLLGVCIAYVHHGDELRRIMESKKLDLRKLTGTFKREPKTQTAEQWYMIAEWSTRIANELGADIDDCDRKLFERFGEKAADVTSSGIGFLARELAARPSK